METYTTTQAKMTGASSSLPLSATSDEYLD